MIDIGESGTSCVAVFDARPIIPQSGWLRLGGQTVLQHTKSMLDSNLPDSIMQDFIVRFGRTGPLPIATNIVYSGYGVSFPVDPDIPSRVYDPLFEMDDDGQSIDRMIVDTIQRAPIDVRRAIAENAVFVGGLCMVDGVRERIRDKVVALLENTGLSFSVVPCAFKPNVAAWVGGMA